MLSEDGLDEGEEVEGELLGKAELSTRLGIFVGAGKVGASELICPVGKVDGYEVGGIDGTVGLIDG